MHSLTALLMQKVQLVLQEDTDLPADNENKTLKRNARKGYIKRMKDNNKGFIRKH